MFVLTFREYARLRRDDKDFGYCVESKQQQRFEGGEGVAEVDQCRYEDHKVEDEGAHVAERHCRGGDG
jgi:hypothetical protein